MIGVRRLEVVAPADDRQGRGERIGWPGDRGQRVGQRDRRRRIQLDQRCERRRQHAALEEIALAGQRVVEHADCRSHAGLAVAERVPGQRNPRGHVVLVGGDDAARHVGVARIHQPGRRGGVLLRSHPGAETADRVVLVDERHRQLVANAQAQRELRRDAELVLRIAGVEPAITVLDRLCRGGAHLRRGAQKKVGRGIASETAAEGEVAVGAVDERNVHRLAPQIEAGLE